MIDKKLRVLLFIDCLNAGGAQRQLVLLAELLLKQNIHVEFLTYNKDDFFKEDVEKLGITINEFNDSTKIKKFFRLRKFLKSSSYDIVISFLSTPNLICEISNLTQNKWKLIVSERNQNFPRFYIKGLFHYFSDRVVLNSNSSFHDLTKKIGISKRKCRVIHNGFNPKQFHFMNNSYQNKKIVVVAKYSQQKNIFKLIESIERSKKTLREQNYSIHWYGDLTKNKEGNYDIYENAKQLIAKGNLYDLIILHKRSHDLVEIYNKSDALLLPSTYEGLPNVVLEGMACKLPILMSKVSDYDLLVKNNQNGFLFDPISSKEMSNTLEKFIRLEPKKKKSMGDISYKILNKNFSNENFVKKYMTLFEEIL